MRRSHVTPSAPRHAPGTIAARRSLSLGGTLAVQPFSSTVSSVVTPEATGNGGHIGVTAPGLAITDGARLQSVSLGAGSAGDVTVESG